MRRATRRTPDLVVAACLLLLIPQFARAADPTTKPTDDVRKLYAQLADPDAEVRESAHTGLLSLAPDRLDDLVALIRDDHGVPPARLPALHEIVTHLFLKTLPYDSIPPEGLPPEQSDANPVTGARGGVTAPYFLGVLSNRTFDEDPGLGVVIEERVPGFAGFEKLRTGDIVLGVVVRPDLPLVNRPNLETHLYTDFQAAVHDVAAAAHDGPPTLTLELIRAGKRTRVAIQLSHRPIASGVTNTAATKMFYALRAQRAEEFWHEQVLPLLNLDDQEQP